MSAKLAVVETEPEDDAEITEYDDGDGGGASDEDVWTMFVLGLLRRAALRGPTFLAAAKADIIDSALELFEGSEDPEALAVAHALEEQAEQWRLEPTAIE